MSDRIDVAHANIDAAILAGRPAAQAEWELILHNLLAAREAE